MTAIGAFGHAEAVAALAAGFASVTLLPGPKADVLALETQIALTNAIAGGEKAALLDTSDPDAMSDALYGAEAPTPVAMPVRPMGTRRQITRQAAKALHPDTDSIGMLAVTAEAAYRVSTPRLVLDPIPNGAGDSVAALFLGYLLRGCGVETALANAAAAIFAILLETEAAGTRELQLVAAQDAVIAPDTTFAVERLG